MNCLVLDPMRKARLERIEDPGLLVGETRRGLVQYGAVTRHQRGAAEAFPAQDALEVVVRPAAGEKQEKEQ